MDSGRRGTRSFDSGTGLKIGCMNIRGGFNGKKNEMLEQAKVFGLDLVAISDVRVKGQVEEVLCGYKVFLSGVSGGRANWGVGIMVRQELEHNILAVRCVNERLMWISLKLDGAVYRFISVYSPCEGAAPAVLDKFFDDLGDIVCRKGSERVILLGDFNARIGDCNSNFDKVCGKFGEPRNANVNGLRLLNFCQGNGLAITNSFFKHKLIHMYTFENVGANCKSIIDYVIVEQDMRKLVRDTRVYRSFVLDTDHHFVGSFLLIKKPVLRASKVICRKIRYDRLNDGAVRATFENRIAEKFRSISSQFVSQDRDIEYEWNDFKCSILGAAADCLGTATCGGSAKNTKWWNSEIKEAVLEKKRIYNLWLQNKCEVNRVLYRDIKLKVKLLIRNAKDLEWKKFGDDLELAGQQRNKKFWTTVKRIRNGLQKSSSGSVLDANGGLVSDQSAILGRWKEYFENLLEAQNGDSFALNDDHEGDMRGISFNEVVFAVRKLKNGKAAGVDEIRGEFLKCSGKAGLEWLHRILNLAWRSGKVPSDWSSAIIAPIYKKGNAKDCNNYRGISLLSIVGKLYATIIEKRVRDIVEDSLDENQCGFRPARGCRDQIFSMRQIIEKYQENNKNLFMCFVDLEKAFDKVPRQTLFEILSEYGVNGALLKSIQSLYVNSRAAVRIDGKLSSWFQVGNGVRQGCCLSPLLFVIYMDKIIKSARFSGKVNIGDISVDCLAYADDLVLMADSVGDLQLSINELNRACNEFQMKISAAKTKVMHVGKVRMNVLCLLDDFSLEQVSEFKYLGCVFSEDGKLDREFEERKRKGNAVTSQLRSHIFSKKELSSNTKLTIHQSIFRPTIMYGSESWVDSGYLVHNLEVADMTVLRMIAGTNRREQWENRISNISIRENLGCLSVEEVARVNRLRWFGHVHQMDDLRLPKRILVAEMPANRSRGRPRRRFIDSVKDDLSTRDLVLNDELLNVVRNRAEWRRITDSG